MASRLPYEVELTISSAKDLKNVNWRHGDLKPYAVAWVDAAAKCSTRVDEEGDTAPVWNEKLTIPLKDRPEESTLWVDIVHANADEDTKPLIGSARLPLRDVLEEVGYGERCSRTLKLKRPSGRPQGKLDVKVTVRERTYRPPPPEPYAYGQGYREYPTERGYGYGYGTAPPSYATAPPARYTYEGSPGYGAAPAYAVPYGADPYYGGSSVGETGKGKKSGYGMGTGLAVGAVAGVLGGLALAEGVDYVEDKIADDVAEKVEDDLGFDEGDYGGDDF